MVPDRFETLASLVFPNRDERFGQVVARLSEPTQAPPADNFVSNEDSYPRVAEALAARTPVDSGSKRVYLGVGPDQNFTFLAHLRPALGFVLDFRRRNVLVHVLHKALVSLCSDRVAYLERLTARHPGPLPKDPTAAELVRAFEDAPLDPARLAASVAEVALLARTFDLLRDDEFAELATIQARLAGPGLNARFLALRMYPTVARMMTVRTRAGLPAHWLGSEALYQVVRSLHLGDRILPLVGDFAGATALSSLGRWLRARRCVVDVLYVSDVEFFLLRQGRLAAYVENLARLPWSERAAIVRTSTREITHPERFPGDSATTVVREARAFIDAARSKRIATVDDLFR